mmetsp:Transcript_15031/g.21059  ORF Transcript_15031/g.21059 Transcript_15031/m.21059 type:complete len:285 (+) Transcript_15031:581-1435(+)
MFSKNYIQFRVLNSYGIVKENIITQNIMDDLINLESLKIFTTFVSKNNLQKKLSKNRAGNKTSAKCWGTGKALARLPRVKGSGTSRSGQAALANICRGGRTFGFSKLKTKWPVKINKKIKVVAFKTALVCSMTSPVVISRGHLLNDVIHFPVIVNSCLKLLWHPRELLMILKNVGGYIDYKKATTKVKHINVSSSYKRSSKKGPLLVAEGSNDLYYLIKNIKGIDYSETRNLSINKFAPGGRPGRLCIFTKRSFLYIMNLINSNILENDSLNLETWNIKSKRKI